MKIVGLDVGEFPQKISEYPYDEYGFPYDKLGFNTTAIHAGRQKYPTGDVTPPIHMSSTYEIENILRGNPRDYARSWHPNRDDLEATLALLDDAKYGLAYPSGMAAIQGILQGLLETGDHIIACNNVYGGTDRLLNDFQKKFKVRNDHTDFTDTKNVEEVIKPETKMFWIESPSNPLMILCDIEEISKIAKEHDIITVVDNTFLSPYFQNPLKMGADITIYSTTKYHSGHSNVLGGGVCLNNEQYYKELKHTQNSSGLSSHPISDWLIRNGIKTLGLRMDKHNENAMKIAEYLYNHDKISKVNYPGLDTHPQHELAKKQQTGFGGMMSFEIRGNSNTIEKFFDNIYIIPTAVSLGGVESLFEWPWSMSPVDEKKRYEIGLTPELVRFSVGTENFEDIRRILDYALSKVD